MQNKNDRNNNDSTLAPPKVWDPPQVTFQILGLPKSVEFPWLSYGAGHLPQPGGARPHVASRSTTAGGAQRPAGAGSRRASAKALKPMPLRADTSEVKGTNGGN